MTDESIINLSDETKSSLRIYATMAGFFILFGVMLYVAVSSMEGHRELITTTNAFGSALLLIIGTTLALLHKRDLFAAFFILFALTQLFKGAIPATDANLPVAIIMAIAALAFVQTRNEQKYIVTGLLFINVLTLSSSYLDACNLADVLLIISAIACLYFAITLACERYKLPLRDMLVADEDVPENDGTPVHFREMGSSIGFLMLALFMALIIRSSFASKESIDPSVLENIMVIFGIIFLILGAIMITAGRMKGTPFYFLCIGFLFLIASSGIMWVPKICFIILGIMILLRKDSRILLGLGIILMGLSFLIVSMLINQPLLSGVIAAIAFLIFAYLTFAVNSNGRLKLV